MSLDFEGGHFFSARPSTLEPKSTCMISYNRKNGKQGDYMRKRKMRGIKRKARLLENNIHQMTEQFPQEFNWQGYWNLRLPTSQDFIESTGGVKQACAKTLVSRLQHLVHNKPLDQSDARVILLLKPRDMWYSEIIVFQNDTILKEFLSREDDYRKWIPTDDHSNGNEVAKLEIAAPLKSKAYKEIITEDGKTSETDFWVIGEI